MSPVPGPRPPGMLSGDAGTSMGPMGPIMPGTLAERMFLGYRAERKRRVGESYGKVQLGDL